MCLHEKIQLRRLNTNTQTHTNTNANTNTHTHRHCLLSRAWKDESTSVFLHDSDLSAKTNSDFSYSSRAYQCCLNVHLCVFVSTNRQVQTDSVRLSRFRHAKGACPRTSAWWSQALISRIIPDSTNVARICACVCASPHFDTKVYSYISKYT